MSVPTPSPSEAPSGPPPLRLLVVDDEAIVRESRGSWSRRDGPHVDVAENAREALHLAARSPHDIRRPPTAPRAGSRA